MYKSIFLDANIFVDIGDSSRKHHRESSSLLKYCILNGIEVFTSCDIITTIYYVNSKRDKLKALDEIISINNICTIIDFSNHEISQTCKLMKNDNAFNDLEDTIQYVLAKKSSCDLIISNDIDFVSKDIELLSSAAFCEKIQFKN